MKLFSFREGHWRIHCMGPDETSLMRQLVRLNYFPDIPDNASQKSITIVHTGSRANVYRVSLNEKVVCVKVFHDNRYKARMRNLFCLSKARSAFNNARSLDLNGLPAPKRIGYAQKNLSGPCLLVTEYCGDGKTIRDYINEATDPAPVIRACRDLSRQMAQKKFYHIDYRARNIIYDAKGKYYLIDLEDIRRMPLMTEKSLYNKLIRRFIKKLHHEKQPFADAFNHLVEP